MEKQDLSRIVDREISKFIALSGVDATYDLNIEEETEGTIDIKVSFEGDNLGYMIGNHGKHLDSLQYILQLIIRREVNEEDFNFRLTIDVSGYRKDRNQKIEQIALQKADDARILGEPIDLTPMKPYDRRVIHMTLQKFDDIETESFGEGRDRHVRIIPTSEEDLGLMDSTLPDPEEVEEGEE
jgi:spoIIIJ-associated protein